GIDPPSLPFGISGPWENGAAFGFLPRFDFIDPLAFYVLMVILVVICVIAANNLYRSRLGRAWMAVREDEVAAAATGVNTVAIKLLAFAIGASFSGFAGTYYGAKLSLVSSENFAFVVSVTVLIMVVLGGMGNIPGVILGALGIYYVLFNLLTNLPDVATNAANAIGLGFLNTSKGDWIFSRIGPNGAGKTTLFSSITGIYRPTSGKVVFEGKDITGLKPYRVAELGIGRTFQQIRLFSYMTAFDNVRVGEHSRMHAKVWDALFKTRREREEEARVTDKAMELLKFVGIEQHTHNYA